MKKNLVILSGAGMSAESGISTFRDAGGLWDKYPVMQVASAEGYVRDPELVINFYNERRKQLLAVEPNAGHIGLAELEKDFNVEGTKSDAAKQVGMNVAERAKAKGIENVVFDRGGYVYHGRVKALAEGAREGGLQF